MNKQTVLTFMLCIFSLFAYAQQSITVKGTVTDMDNNPLIGAAVSVVGTSTGVITDLDGRYTIKTSPTQSLRFSYVGYQEQTIKANGQTTIDVQLLEGQELEEVVVIGYGVVKKKDLTGAVASVSGKELQAGLSRNASNALQGRIAGVTVTSASGQPGEGMNINIRGVNSMSNTKPLYVIDGVYGDINMIEPSDIQSIDILKDASAAAIYGSRAANGVVLITTKGGMKDLPARIEVDAYTGIQNMSKKLDVLDGDQFRDYCKKNNIGSNITDIQNWRGAGTDWQDELYRTAMVNKVALNISGGTKTATYNVSASYLNQEGIIKTTGYEAWNIRAKNTFSFFNDHLRVGSTLMMKMWDKDYDNVGITLALRQNPLMNPYDENGVNGWGAVSSWMRSLDNPVGWVEAWDRQKHGIDMLINGYAEVDLGLKGLKYKFNVGVDKYTRRSYDYGAKYNFGPSSVHSFNEVGESTSWESNWLIENTLHYDNMFGKHMVSALLGYSAQKDNYRSFNAGRNKQPDGIYVIGAGDSSSSTAGSGQWANSMVSLFARAMYSYDSRYMLSASIRRDGSSKFADGHRYGVFPSASIGWNIMNESFFENAKNTVNELKIRASYGVLGNLNGAGNYDTQSVIKQGINYVQGGSWWMGSITNAAWVSPKALTWEKSKTFNVGLDGSIFNNKLSLSVDYFVQRTKDLLLGINQPQSSGMTGSPTLNAATMENKGIEIALNHRNTIGDFYYRVGVNMSAIKNNLKEITTETKQEFTGYSPHGEGSITWAKVGKPIGSFYLVKTDGLFQSEEEIQKYKSADGKVIQPNAKPGDIRYIDYNGDGQINDEDQQYCGNPFPKLTMGINLGAEWKGIDLNLFFDSSFGNKIYNGTRYYTSFMQTGITNVSSELLNEWTETNRNTDIPRYTTDDLNHNNMPTSDRYLENGSYFRLKTLELGYTFPKIWTSKIKLQSLRLYTAMDNLFTITNYKGYTPDLGVVGGDGTDTASGSGIMTRGCDDGRYPLARTFTFGLQVRF